MAKDQNIALHKRWGEEVASQGNVDVLDEILAADFVDHDPAPDQGPGIEGLKDFFRSFRTAFPDLEASVDELVATDDHVTMRYTVRGTHQGEFMGVAPTGRKIEAPAMQLSRIENGKVTERWGVTDQSKILEQIGALE